MMQISNEIVLRPRFSFEQKNAQNSVLEAFETAKKSQNTFTINRLGAHVFLKIPVEEQHFWSPQLHLEVLDTDPSHCKIKGFFGPNPTVWTLFMFLHFVVAGLFIGFGIWAYSSWSLETNVTTPVILMVMMVVLWIAIYISGRMGKQKGQHQMHELHDFMNAVLKTI